MSEGVSQIDDILARLDNDDDDNDNDPDTRMWLSTTSNPLSATQIAFLSRIIGDYISHQRPPRSTSVSRG